jgi:2-iminobutanoate/2-iminopropanoate deaminase
VGSLLGMVIMGTPLTIQTADAPTPTGHYCQAAAHGDLVFVSGQLPVRPDGGESDRSFEAQVRQALSNLFAILSAAGSSPEHVLKVTVFLVGIEKWPIFNQLFGEVFGAVRPARSVVPVPHLHDGYLIEIEAIAIRIAEPEAPTPSKASMGGQDSP